MPLNKKTTNYSRKFVFMRPDASYQHRWQKEKNLKQGGVIGSLPSAMIAVIE